MSGKWHRGLRDNAGRHEKTRLPRNGHLSNTETPPTTDIKGILKERASQDSVTTDSMCSSELPFKV